jgi:protein-S-isoprenylcysteine O-methyltransferase Ste14
MRLFLPPALFLALLLPTALIPFMKLDVFRIIHKSGTPFWEAAICGLLGLVFLIGARIQFKNSGSEIMTFKTPKNLVTHGFFRVSRNPMYLGFLLLLVALALAVNIWQALFAPLIFFAVAHYWYTPCEEEAAEQAFGASYDQYKSKVRRWV